MEAVQGGTFSYKPRPWEAVAEELDLPMNQTFDQFEELSIPSLRLSSLRLWAGALAKTVANSRPPIARRMARIFES